VPLDDETAYYEAVRNRWIGTGDYATDQSGRWMDTMASQTPPTDRDAEGTPPDPSMQDILASIRRILSEDADKGPVSATTPHRMTPAAEPAPSDDILDLDAGLMVNDKTGPPPGLAGPVTQTPPSEAEPGMIAPEAAATSMSQLRGQAPLDAGG